MFVYTYVNLWSTMKLVFTNEKSKKKKNNFTSKGCPFFNEVQNADF